MLIHSAEFVKSAAKPSQYPAGELPEIAFAGRSNVGKSSLINALLNRRRLVKTSSTPGRTRLINFFAVNQRFLFVDLPGYGYAKVPKSVRRSWQPMIETYLSRRTTLNGIVMLLDIRRLPDEKDRDLLRWFAAHRLPVILVLTKADKLAKSRREARRLSVAAALGIGSERLVLFSAKTREGIDALWRALAPLVGESP
jgi:GTP-binding protein